MTPEQEAIFTEIAQLRHELDANFNPSRFVFNEKIAKILDRISELQEGCAHEYTEQGICKICGRVKE